MMETMTPSTFVLIALVVALALAPPRWDPAIRWKERQQWERRHWTQTPSLSRLTLVWLAYLFAVALCARLVLG